MSDISSQLFPSADGHTVGRVADPLGNGVFLHFRAGEASARQIFDLGPVANLRRFTCCHRMETFWMNPAAGTRVGEVPIETQFLLVELLDGTYSILVPLIDERFRSSLEGNSDDRLQIVCESGDPGIVTRESTALFVASGRDPYELMRAGAESVVAWLKTGRLRRDKSTPAFADQFGWCTWDAFYQEVSEDKVRGGLETFAAGGLTPKFLILDDGWQSVRKTDQGHVELTGFAATPDKFPDGLGGTVKMAKSEFGVETFLVWHAMNGYWGGVDGDALPGYNTRLVARSASPGILHHMPEFNSTWSGIVGLVSPEHIYRFFQDYHRTLRQQGVDGVKVDSQATLELIAYGSGGRVELMRSYREALEGSTQTHFAGNLINCMSCASEMLYSALNSNITRTSIDFWPNRPETHGEHLYTNAHVSAWFGEFIEPDWDMFQSGHEAGGFHAAGRAVGGCPVYVSDKPGQQNFDLLRKLVLPDGSVLRADIPGRPTPDCLFSNPTKEDVLLKIFNRNGDAGIVGAFNARYAADGAGAGPIAGSVRPSDVVGIAGDKFAVYAHTSGELRLLSRDDAWDIALKPLGYEVFTVVPVDSTVIAPIGLTGMFNSAGAVASKGLDEVGRYVIGLRYGGRFLAWCASSPKSVEIDGATIAFSYDASSQRLEIDVPEVATPTIRISW